MPPLSIDFTGTFKSICTNRIIFRGSTLADRIGIPDNILLFKAFSVIGRRRLIIMCNRFEGPLEEKTSPQKMRKGRKRLSKTNLKDSIREHCTKKSYISTHAGSR